MSPQHKHTHTHTHTLTPHTQIHTHTRRPVEIATGVSIARPHTSPRAYTPAAVVFWSASTCVCQEEGELDTMERDMAVGEDDADCVWVEEDPKIWRARKGAWIYMLVCVCVCERFEGGWRVRDGT